MDVLLTPLVLDPTCQLWGPPVSLFFFFPPFLFYLLPPPRTAPLLAPPAGPCSPSDAGCLPNSSPTPCRLRLHPTPGAASPTPPRRSLPSSSPAAPSLPAASSPPPPAAPSLPPSGAARSLLAAPRQAAPPAHGRARATDGRNVRRCRSMQRPSRAKGQGLVPRRRAGAGSRRSHGAVPWPKHPDITGRRRSPMPAMEKHPSNPRLRSPTEMQRRPSGSR